MGVDIRVGGEITVKVVLLLNGRLCDMTCKALQRLFNPATTS